jgi:3-oxoacyl-[acyl-carrier-protein] synthase II
MLLEFGGFNLKDAFAPVWQREPKGGIALGSLGAFLVIEERAHADARGARRLARLSTVLSDRSKRQQDGDVTNTLARMHDSVAGRLVRGRHAVISGASGGKLATAEERAYLAQHPDVPVRATGTHLGHSLEPQFPMNVAIAALTVSHGSLFAPADSSGVERPMAEPLQQALVTGVGHWRGEGLALVEAAN